MPAEAKRGSQLATLGDILSSFGATADFWSNGDDASEEALTDDPTFARSQIWDEAWDELKTLLAGLSDEEAASVKETLVNGVLSKKPDPERLANMYEALADVFSTRGDRDAATRVRDRAAGVASKAREALFSDHRDPQHLCCLGRLLLDRCDADDLPLCEENFIGSVFEFGNGDTLRVDYFSFIDPTVEYFPNEPETFSLAIRAFGLAWLYYRERSEKRSDAWRALPALDGLRAAFLHSDHVEALEAVSETFWDWVEDWDLIAGGSSDEFVANFRSSDAYLHGRLRRDPANRRLTGRKLASKLGDTWDRLPKLAREYLINAEILFEHLDKKGDWSSAVNDYSKATEALLRERLGRQLDHRNSATLTGLIRSAIDQARGRETRQYSRVSLSTFSQALQQVVPRLNNRSLKQVSNDLEKLARIRGRADHAVAEGGVSPWKISREECERVRDICLGARHDGLVRLLADLDLNN
jgi:hypothetical protein